MSDGLAELALLAPSSGRDVLDRVAQFLSRFIGYPSEHALHAHTLWLAHTWRMDAWDSTPRLAFMSPEKGSGKTRALEVSEYLVPRYVRVSNASAAYVLTKVSAVPPCTLFYDEIDTVYGPRAKGNEDLRAVLNAGHRRGAMAGRASWNNGLEAQDYSAYCAVALAGLGSLPDTVADRSVVIRMKKRKQSEPVSAWRERIHRTEAEQLGEYLGAWMERVDLDFPTYMPVEDRAADVWEALVMIANAAGGHWPERAWNAAVAASADETADSLGVQLLGDLWRVFRGVDKLPTQRILEMLVDLPESRWRSYHADGQPMNARDLSRLVKPYDVSSCDLWIDGRSVKGYLADDLFDTWQRYLPPSLLREVGEVREEVCSLSPVATG